MPTFPQFLELNRPAITATMCGWHTFEGIVEDVIRVSKTQRGAGILVSDPRSVIEALTLAASWPVRIGDDAGAALVVTDEIVKRSKRPRVIAMLTARAKIGILTRHGGLRWVNARCVYEGEDFEAVQGVDPHVVKHQDLTFSPVKRGKLAGAYVQGLQKHGLPCVLELMNRFDIDQIRQEWSRELRDGELEDLEHFAQYAMAKCIHRFVDRLQVSDQVRGWLSDLPPQRPDAAIKHEPAPADAPVVSGMAPRDPRAPLALGALMAHPSDHPSFLSEFSDALRYVLQQHERAIRARMRHDNGEPGAIADANHYECLIEEGAQRLALVVLECGAASTKPTTPPDGGETIRS